MHIEHISSVSTLLFYTAYTALNVNTNSDKKKKKNTLKKQDIELKLELRNGFGGKYNNHKKIERGLNKIDEI